MVWVAARTGLPVRDLLDIDGVYESAVRMLKAEAERAQEQADERARLASIQKAMGRG